MEPSTTPTQTSEVPEVTDVTPAPPIAGPIQEAPPEPSAPETPPVTPQEPPRNEAGQFVPGYSGNPAGKPVGAKHLTTKLKEALAKQAAKDPKTGELLPIEDALIRKVVNMALGGNERMIGLIWSYIEGKPVQPVDFDVNKAGLGELTEFFKMMAAPKLPPVPVEIVPIAELEASVAPTPDGTPTIPGGPQS